MGDYRSKILGKLPKIHDLPGLPTVFVEIDRVIQSPNSGAAELAKVIETDPPTVASLLKMANSSYYWGRQESIPSVRDAVVRLGLQEVRRLCQFACLSRLFVRPSTLVNHSQFWRHSFAVGSVARRIAEAHAASLKQEPDVAFTAGLLHDIGSLILDQFFENLYRAVHEEAQKSGRGIAEVELELLSLDHGDVGAALLRHWELPDVLSLPAEFHHRVTESPATLRVLCALVGLAEEIVAYQGLPGPGEWATNEPANRPDDWGLPLSEADIRHWQSVAKQEIADSSLLMAG